MIVYTVLVKEDEWETSKEYFGVFSSLNSALENLKLEYPDSCRSMFEKEGDYLRTKYSVSKTYSRNYYHIYIYKEDVL